jgi:hypothetical protein
MNARSVASAPQAPQRRAIGLFAVMAIALASGCASPAPRKSGASVDAGAASGEEAVAKLNRLLPDFQETVRPFLPGIAQVLAGVDTQFTNVIAYGRWLENHPSGDADSLTIGSDLYWSAFATMAMRDPAVYFSRIFVLVGEGRLARARYVRFFTDLHMDHGQEADQKVMEFLGKSMEDIRGASDRMVERGIAEYDQGRKDKAARFYEAALGIYPKSPRANYELGLTLMTENLERGRAGDGGQEAYFARTRAYDPFFTFAYQGKKETAAKMIVILKEVEPSFKAIQGKRPTAGDFGKFADACAKLGEWELAAYAYHVKLSMTLDRENGFDAATADRFVDCIRELGAVKAAEDLRAEYHRYNTLLAEKRKK